MLRKVVSFNLTEYKKKLELFAKVQSKERSLIKRFRQTQQYEESKSWNEAITIVFVIDTALSLLGIATYISRNRI